MVLIRYHQKPRFCTSKSNKRRSLARAGKKSKEKVIGKPSSKIESYTFYSEETEIRRPLEDKWTLKTTSMRRRERKEKRDFVYSQKISSFHKTTNIVKESENLANENVQQKEKNTKKVLQKNKSLDLILFESPTPSNERISSDKNVMKSKKVNENNECWFESDESLSRSKAKRSMTRNPNTLWKRMVDSNIESMEDCLYPSKTQFHQNSDRAYFTDTQSTSVKNSNRKNNAKNNTKLNQSHEKVGELKEHPQSNRCFQHHIKTNVNLQQSSTEMFKKGLGNYYQDHFVSTDTAKNNTYFDVDQRENRKSEMDTKYAEEKSVCTDSGFISETKDLLKNKRNKTLVNSQYSTLDLKADDNIDEITHSRKHSVDPTEHASWSLNYTYNVSSDSDERHTDWRLSSEQPIKPPSKINLFQNNQERKTLFEMTKHKEENNNKKLNSKQAWRKKSVSKGVSGSSGEETDQSWTSDDDDSTLSHVSSVVDETKENCTLSSSEHESDFSTTDSDDSNDSDDQTETYEKKFYDPSKLLQKTVVPDLTWNETYKNNCSLNKFYEESADKDLTLSSLECLLEMLLQRGKVKHAYILSDDGEIIVESHSEENDSLLLLPCEASTVLCALESNYQGPARLDVLGQQFTCFKYSMVLMGKSPTDVIVVAKANKASVIGVSQVSGSGSCLNEVKDFSKLLIQRGM